MPATIGAGRGYPGMTENRPLSYAASQAGVPQPPTGIVGFGNYGVASGAAPSATIGGGQQPWTGPAVPPATIGPGNVYAGNLANANASYPNIVNGYQAPAAGSGAQGSAAGVGANILPGLPAFDRGGSGMLSALSADPATTIAQLGPAYSNAFNAYANNIQNQTNTINAGYNQTAQNQYNAQQGVNSGYNNLSRDVLGGIAGIGSDQLALLNRNYARQAGSADQNLISSGLGNSTVRSNVQRGIGLDQNLAQNNLANSIAQTKAGYQSNIGLAGLGYQGQSIRDNTALSQDQFHWLNSITSLPPDAAQYSQIAQQAGSAIQSGLDRAQAERLQSQSWDRADQQQTRAMQAGVLGASGGTAAGTGGRLPPSAVNYAGQPMGGSGAGGLDFGTSFFTPPGGGGGGSGGQFQNANSGGGTRAAPGTMLASGPGVTNYLNPGGAGAAMLGGAGMAAGGAYGGYATPEDQYNALAAIAGQQAAAAAAAQQGGDGFWGSIPDWAQPEPQQQNGFWNSIPGWAGADGYAGSFGGDMATGFGDALGSNVNWGGYTGGAYDAGSGAFGGAIGAMGGDFWNSGSVGSATDTGAGAFGGAWDW